VLEAKRTSFLIASFSKTWRKW